MDYFLTSNKHIGIKSDTGALTVVDVKYHAQIQGSDHCPVSLTLAATHQEEAAD